MADRTVRVRLIADIAGYRAAMQQAAQTTSQFGRELTANTKQSNDVMRQLGHGAMLAGAGLVAGFAIAGRAAMNFDQVMSEVGAAASATRSEVGALREAALQAGADTAFSASEAARAEAELAKAGVSVSDVLGGGLAGALDLAAAGSLDLGRAAEIAAGAMTTFGLSGGDVGRIADALAAGANKSAADVDDMAMALAQAGLVANQMGLSMEETVGTLSLFAQNALKGSDAGTSLRTLLMRLAAPTDIARAKMQELGLEIYDASGNMLPFADVAENVQNALTGLTGKQRAAAESILFGADAIRGANILFQEGGDGVRDWTEAVSESGYAAELAARKMDNLAGDVEEFMGSVETALIKGGSTATPVLRFITQQATGAVNAFGDLPPVAQGAGMALVGLGGTALIVAGGIATVAVKVNQARVALEALGPAGEKAAAFAGTLGKFGARAAQVSAVVAVLYGVGEAIDALFPIDTSDLAQLENALLSLGDTGRITGELADSMGGDLTKLSQAIERISAPSVGTQVMNTAQDIASLGGLIGGSDDMEQAARRIDDIDKALASLARRNPEAAAISLARLTSELEAQGVPAERLRGLLDDYDAVLAEIDTESRTAAGGTGRLTGELGPVAEAFDVATEAAQDYVDQLRASVDPLFGMLDALNGNRDAQLEFSDANAAALVALDELNHAVHEHGRNSDEAREAQRNYEDALRGVQDAQLGTAQSALDLNAAAADLAIGIANGTVSLDEARAMLDSWVGQGILTAEQAAAMGEAFGFAAEKAGEIQPQVTTQIEADTSDIVAKVDGVVALIAGTTPSMPVDADTGDAEGSVDDLVDLIAGTGASVQIDADIHAALAKLNALRAAANRGIIVQPSIGQRVEIATGGLIPGTGDGDTVPAMLTPGEFVIRKSAVRAVGVGRLHRLNAQRFADGGFVAQGHSFANFHNAMIGNLSGTAVGRNAVRAAGPGGDPSADLEQILDLYVQLSDTLGQAAADQILWSTQTVEGFELVAQGALDAKEAADEAAEAAERVAREHQAMHDVMFAVGDMGTGEYLAILNQRLAATEKYSAEWFEIWQDIQRVTEDAVAGARQALEAELSELSSLYVRASQELARQQEAYGEAVAERQRRIVEETARFRGDIVSAFQQAVNPVDLFGGRDDITSGELEAALKHRLDAAAKFAATYAQLAAKGVNQDVLTQLAQRGPEGLGLANALLDVDPQLINQAMSQTAELGGQVADVALSWERARIEQQVYADVALPTVQTMNELLAEGLALREQEAEQQAAAEAWAHGMADQTLPALAGGYRSAADAAWDLVAAQQALGQFGSIGAGGDMRVTAEVNVTAPAGFGATGTVRAGYGGRSAVGQVGQRLVMGQRR